jgi:hypothetical protein
MGFSADACFCGGGMGFSVDACFCGGGMGFLDEVDGCAEGAGCVGGDLRGGVDVFRGFLSFLAMLGVLLLGGRGDRARVVAHPRKTATPHKNKFSLIPSRSILIDR